MLLDLVDPANLPMSRLSHNSCGRFIQQWNQRSKVPAGYEHDVAQGQKLKQNCIKQEPVMQSSGDWLNV